MKGDHSMPIPRVPRRAPKAPTALARPPWPEKRLRAALARDMARIGDRLSPEVHAAVRSAPSATTAMQLAAEALQRVQAASAAGRTTRVALASAAQVEEARALARLRRSGWRALPDGTWRSPKGEICRSFGAAVRCLEIRKSNPHHQ